MQHQRYFDSGSGSSGSKSSSSSNNPSQANDCNFRHPYREMCLGRQQHRVIKIEKIKRYEQKKYKKK